MLAYMSPKWFYGYDIGLELIFAIITIAVALFAYKIYKATNQNYAKYLSIAFFLIGISNIIQSIINFLIVSKFNENICNMMKIQSITHFNTIAIYTHMLLFTLGLVFLIYMILKIERKSILLLLTTISILAMLLSENVLYTFYILSSSYLLIISGYFIRNYLKNKNTKTLLIAVAFLFLLVGSVHFLFSINHQLFYAIGYILEFVAYILILSNLVMVRKK